MHLVLANHYVPPIVALGPTVKRRWLSLGAADSTLRETSSRGRVKRTTGQTRPQIMPIGKATHLQLDIRGLRTVSAMAPRPKRSR